MIRSISVVLLALFAAASVQAAAPATSDRSKRAIARVTPGLQAALAPMNVNPGVPIHIRIFKQERELELWVERGDRFVLFRTYPICAFSGDLGPKLREGDNQSPEGFYSVTATQLNPASQFHLSFNLGYPNQYDRANGRTGAALMVHGNCVSIGCYAMTDRVIEEIYTLADAALRGGQRALAVHVFPFRMTDAALAKHRDSRWHTFWRDLKPAYDLFERNHRPPRITVRDRRYVVSPHLP